MKRLHVHVSVREIGASTRFYSTLFGSEPTVTKHDYAKWMLDDPRANFAISTGEQEGEGVKHLGIQVESDAELADVYARLEAAEGPTMEEGTTTCCYARSEKSWITDPQGVIWEAFHTTGDAVEFGKAPELAAIDETKPTARCCA